MTDRGRKKGGRSREGGKSQDTHNYNYSEENGALN